MYFLCFEEFIMATGQARLLQAFREQQRSKAVHQMLWSQLLDFYFVGGMPEAVANWFEVEGSAYERTQKIIRIHRDLIAAYQRDFGKYAGKYHAQHIETVFQNVPRQLAASQDGSVQRFKFKDVIAAPMVKLSLSRSRVANGHRHVACGHIWIGMHQHEPSSSSGGSEAIQMVLSKSGLCTTRNTCVNCS